RDSARSLLPAAGDPAPRQPQVLAGAVAAPARPVGARLVPRAPREPLSRAVAPAALSPGEDRRVYRGVEHGDQNPDHEQLEILGRQYPHAGRSHFTGEPHAPVYTRRAMKPSRFDVIAGLGARAQLLEGHFRSRPGPD